MRPTFTILFTACALAGCADTAAPAAAGGEADAQAAAGDALQPGLWAVDVATPAGRQTVRQCITAADLAEGRLLGDAAPEAGDCRFDRREVRAGRIDIDLRCDGADGGPTRVRQTGRFAADRLTARTTLSSPGMPDAVVSYDGRRVAAACPADS